MARVAERIQLSRKKGWTMPPNAVKVDRTTKWGNPFVAHGDGRRMDNMLAVSLFQKMLKDSGSWCPIPTSKWQKGKVPTVFTSVDDVRRELRGKNLACWCALDEPCHADVLLELANQVSSGSSSAVT